VTILRLACRSKITCIGKYVAAVALCDAKAAARPALSTATPEQECKQAKLKAQGKPALPEAVNSIVASAGFVVRV
jgi:hypothetical protein